MHVISDLQQRPSKSRLKVEKGIIPFYDLCTVVQAVCLIVYTTSFSISSRRTFKNTVWLNRNLSLVDSLKYKTSDCSYKVTNSAMYAFSDINLVLYSSNVDNIFADMANQMRLAVFICATAILFAVINRSAMDSNFFSFQWRNFIFHKDLISAVELALLPYVLQVTFMARAPASLLSDYLHFCGVEREVFLPFLSLVPLYVFVAVGLLTYLVALPVYLLNALPKYGIMTEAQIADYKVWLCSRRDAMAQAKSLEYEARQASMRLHMLLRNPHGAAFPPARRNAAGLATQPPAEGAEFTHPAQNNAVNMTRRRDAYGARPPAASSLTHSMNYVQPGDYFSNSVKI